MNQCVSRANGGPRALCELPRRTSLPQLALSAQKKASVSRRQPCVTPSRGAFGRELTAFLSGSSSSTQPLLPSLFPVRRFVKVIANLRAVFRRCLVVQFVICDDCFGQRDADLGFAGSHHRGPCTAQRRGAT